MTCQSILPTFAIIMAGSAIAQNVPAAHAAFAANQQLRQNSLPGARLTIEQKRALAAYGQDVAIEFSDHEVPSNVVGHLGARLHPQNAVAEAQEVLERHGAAFRRGPNDNFVLSSLETDKNGTLRVRMTQTYDGFHVAGAELAVHLDRDSVRAITGRFVPDLAVQTDGSDRHRPLPGPMSFSPDEELVSVQSGKPRNPVIFVDKEGTGHLAIPVQVMRRGEEDGGRWDVFIDARTGSVLGRQALPSPAAPVPFNNRLLNPGFESGNANWTGRTHVYTATLPVYRNEPPVCRGATAGGARTGNYWACLGGSGRSNTEWLEQEVTVPSDAVNGTLSFWMHISTYENPEIFPYIHDTLTIEVTDGVTVRTMAVFSNLNEYNYRTWQQVAIPFPAGFRGKKVKVRFVATEDGSKATWFDIDDTALTFTGL